MGLQTLGGLLEPLVRTLVPTLEMHENLRITHIRNFCLIPALVLYTPGIQLHGDPELGDAVSCHSPDALAVRVVVVLRRVAGHSHGVSASPCVPVVALRALERRGLEHLVRVYEPWHATPLLTALALHPLGGLLLKSLVDGVVVLDGSLARSFASAAALPLASV